MRKPFMLRLMRLFTAMVAVTGIALHPANKLVDGVSGATRQKGSISLINKCLENKYLLF